MDTTPVALSVDPLCPWCWLTALWLYEVETVRPIAVTTGVLSLAEVNRESDHVKSGKLADGERALRLLAAARREGGERAIRGAYLSLGEAHHEEGHSLGDDTLAPTALAAAGLTARLVDTLDDDDLQQEVLREHREAVARGAFGVPAISVDGGPLFFGPVVRTRITGEDAGRLWDSLQPLLRDERVFELKRPRGDVRPEVGRRRQPLAAAG